MKIYRRISRLAILAAPTLFAVVEMAPRLRRS